ncbi:unnamed protein product [Vicia faba]|uniref:Uncharacterized protein n=1 Tax=Vicia faba TaxID=3906 RepID=A0AAV0ZRY9_VICFA|nr:unnamed protein product [Vicia faba]
MTEIPRKEKEQGIFPDLDIDTYMKLITIFVEGQSKNLKTKFVVKILGLDIYDDTLVGDGLDRCISGGQRKRLTTSILKISSAEGQVVGAKIIFAISQDASFFSKLLTTDATRQLLQLLGPGNDAPVRAEALGAIKSLSAQCQDARKEIANCI